MARPVEANIRFGNICKSDFSKHIKILSTALLQRCRECFVEYDLSAHLVCCLHTAVKTNKRHS